MTVRTLTPDEQIALLVLSRDDVTEAAHFLRNDSGVYSGRQAARLEAVVRHLEDVIANQRMQRRDDG